MKHRSGKPGWLAGLLIWVAGVGAMGGWLAFGQGSSPAGSGAVRGSSAPVDSGPVAVASFANAMIFNAAAGNTIKLLLRDNVTSSTIVNPIPGQSLTLLLCQGAAGARTMAWPSNVKLSGGAFALTRSPNKCDALTLVYDGSSWYEISRAMNE